MGPDTQGNPQAISMNRTYALSRIARAAAATGQRRFGQRSLGWAAAAAMSAALAAPHAGAYAQPAVEERDAPASRAASAEPGSTAPVETAPRVPAGPIVLLVPPRNSDFGRAAAALRAGFRAAHERDGAAVPIEVIEGADDAATLAVRYRELAARGVAVVVGPLTRSGVNALAEIGPLPVPTLALNQPDVERTLPSNALAFGLPIEGEARQVAQLAYAQAQAAAQRSARSVPRAAVISAASPLARRAAIAFYDAWREQGGVADLPAEFEPRAAPELRGQLALADVDAVFVAGGADLVRAVRSATASQALPGASAAMPAGTSVDPAAEAGASMPVYATSIASAALGPERRLPELDGVRVIEMPWLVLPNHPSVAAFPKPQGMMANRELQRLYALGIDAYRVAVEMGRQRPLAGLDGATGRLNHDGLSARLERAGVPSEYRNGMPAPLAGR